jgi:glucokinase
MLLVGDIGATNTRLAAARKQEGRFQLERVEVYPSREAESLLPLAERYLAEHALELEGASFGLPGPVENFRVRTTNLPWEVDGRALEDALRVPVALLNDLEAAAWGLEDLRPEDLRTLQSGHPSGGHQAVIAPGTGLGEALVVREGGRSIPVATEGSHTEFGPACEEDVDLWRFLRRRHGHVSYERIASGPGLVALYEFHAARAGAESEPPWREGEDPAARIAQAAEEGTSAACRAAMTTFCRVLGAEAGNLALKALTRGGVFVAGGIAPKILGWLEAGDFLEGFHDKGRYRELMASIPVHVVMDPLVGMRGAARALAARDPGTKAG